MHDVLELLAILLGIGGAVLGYFRFRGRQFGLTDLLIFGVLSVAADILTYTVFQAVSGSHSDSAAYGALVAFIVLIGLVPLAAGINLIAFIALIVCAVRYPAVRYGAALAAIAAWMLHGFMGNVEQMQAPGGMLNDDKLAGEHWALENGVRTREDCDRQSSAKAFRQGCYAQLPR